MGKAATTHQKKFLDEIRYIDLFCGIGGFHIATDLVCKARSMKAECVFASDIDKDCQTVYEANFGIKPMGDITKINEKEIPDHDLLFAGFPCQSFSICGDRKGFEDTRGTLFFDIARILKEKKPKAFILENVKQLKTHDNERTLARIIETLENLGYIVHFKILNALNFGLPQKRERIFIIGFCEPYLFSWPENIIPMKPLSTILEKNPSEFYFASSKIQQDRLRKREGKINNYDGSTIWHENKGGNISIYPFSCALRAGASYNYLLVDGKRRLTEREMLRLQGFPEDFRIVCSYSATRKQAGNSVAIPCVTAVLNSLLNALQKKIYKNEKPYKAIQEKLDLDCLVMQNV